MDKYCEAYRVSSEMRNCSCYFVRDRYFSDEESIRNNLERKINNPGPGHLRLTALLRTTRGFKEI
jgi:hypothetical protein